MNILGLLPLIAMLFATILSFVYVIDMFINIKKHTMRVLKRQRIIALWLTGLAIFVLFFHIGITGTALTLVAFGWLLSASLWFFNAITTNKNIIRKRAEQEEVVLIEKENE